MSILFIGVLTVMCMSLIMTCFFFCRVLLSVHYMKVEGKRMLSYHTSQVDVFMMSFIPLVGSLEVLVFLHGGRWGNPLLFSTHVLAVLSFVITIGSMRYLWTGKKSPKVHKALAKIMCTCFGCMLTTGLLLGYQLFF